jgi:hypothetical protein
LTYVFFTFYVSVKTRLISDLLKGKDEMVVGFIVWNVKKWMDLDFLHPSFLHLVKNLSRENVACVSVFMYVVKTKIFQNFA